jgi:hypothetical protein
MPVEVVPIVQCWIEVQVSRYGNDLERDDTIQQLWLFVMERVIPRLDPKLGNWHHFILLCIRQEISKIRKQKQKDNRTLSPEQGTGRWQRRLKRNLRSA